MAYTKKVWKDYPDTTTPILASDMNNIENGIEAVDNGIENIENGIETLDNVTKYITATAASNGDFKINISNTLTAGMIVNISFPTPTNSSSNARLSINNGTTYYAISRPADAVQLIASDVSGKRVKLFFNGTTFLAISGTNLKGKSIVVRKNTSQSIASQTQTKLTFQTVDAGYDSNVFALSNNDIVIKSKLIKSVACTVYYQITASLNTVTYLFKNSSQLAALGRAAADSGTMSGIIDNLALNDTINFRIWLVSAGNVSAAADWNYAIITVLDTYE